MGETSTVTIDFRINSWLENAGIVGLTRILKANPRYRRSYKEKENTLKQEISQIKQKFNSKLKAEELKIGIIIGPEGGIDEEEEKMLRENGIRVITLGNRILRTETVALNMLSIIMYELEERS